MFEIIKIHFDQTFQVRVLITYTMQAEGIYSVSIDVNTKNSKSISCSSFTKILNLNLDLLYLQLYRYSVNKYVTSPHILYIMSDYINENGCQKDQQRLLIEKTTYLTLK